MASFSLRILFVEDEVPPSHDLFPSDREHFPYIVTPVTLTHLIQLSPQQLADDYDLVVFDRRGSSTACPPPIRHWISEQLATGLDGLLLISQKDPSLTAMLEENSANAAAVSYLITPIDPIEFKIVMQRQDNKRKQRLLFDEVNRVAEQLTFRAAQTGADVLDDALATVVGSTCRAAVQIVGVEHSGTVRFEWNETADHYGDHAIMLADYPSFKKDPITQTIIPVRGVPVEESLLNDRLPIPIEDVATHPGLGAVREILLRYDIQSLLLVPVVVNGRVVASFSLDSVGRRRQFTPDEIVLCQNLARQIGVTISKIEKEQEAETMRRAWKSAQQIAQVAARGDVNETMDCIVHAITRELKGDIATLYIFDDDKEVNKFILRYVDGCAISSAVEPYEATEDSALGRIISLEGTDHYFSEDAPNDDTFKGYFVQAEQVQTAFAMQLRHGRQKVGVLFINYRRRKHLKAYEINTFRAFGHQAAVSIKTTLLNQQANRQKKMLDSLYAADTIGVDTDNVTDALMRITQVAQEAVGGLEAGGEVVSHIALVQGDQLRFAAAYPPENLAVLNSRVHEVRFDPIHPKSLAAKAVMEGKTLLEQNANQLDCYIPCFPGVNAQISVPLMEGQTKIGVLTVEKKTPPYITQHDRENLEHLAGHAIAYIRAHRQLRLVTSLLAAWSRMPLLEGDQDSDRLLMTIADVVRETFNSDQVAIYSYDQVNDAVTLPAVISGVQREKSTFYEALLRAPKQRQAVGRMNENSAIARLLRSGKNEFAPDVTQNEVLKYSDTVRREGIQSSAAILLKISSPTGAERTLGVLFLNFRHRRIFQNEQQKEIQLFAHPIAYALYNVQVSQELAYRQGYFEDQNWITKSQKCWGEKMGESVGDILSTVQAIESDLNTIVPKVPALTEIQDRLSQITMLTADIGRITNIPNQGLGIVREPVEINRLVKERVETIWKREWDNMSYLTVADNHHVTVALEPAFAEVDAEWLRYVVDLVIDIAVDRVQACDEKNIEVSVVLHRDPNHVEIMVLDSHPLAAGDEIQRGRTLEQNVQWRVARTILRTYNGDLRFEADHNRRGSLYILDLPLCTAPPSRIHRHAPVVR